MPVFGLDGGKALRGVLWALTGDRFAAARATAVVGRALVAVPVFGFALLLLVSGRVLYAVAFTLAGWWLWRWAGQSASAEVARARLRGVPVSAVMERNVRRIRPDATLDQLFGGRALSPFGPPCFVVAGSGELLGRLTYADLGYARHLPGHRTAAELMVPLERLDTLAPDHDALDAFAIMEQRRVTELPVVSDGELAGVLTLAAWSRAVKGARELPIAADGAA